MTILFIVAAILIYTVVALSGVFYCNYRSGKLGTEYIGANGDFPMFRWETTECWDFWNVVAFTWPILGPLALVIVLIGVPCKAYESIRDAGKRHGLKIADRKKELETS